MKVNGGSAFQRIIFGAVILMLRLPNVWASDTEVHSTVDWEAGQVIIDATIGVVGSYTPKSRFLAEEEVQDEIAEVFLDSVMPLAVDSLRLVSESLDDDWRVPENLRRLSLSGKKENAHYTTDMREIRLRYTFPFFGEKGLTAPFVTHQSAMDVPPSLGFVPTRRYSGLVIFAQGALPLYGHDRSAALQPAFFPKLYDDDLTLVLAREMTDPALVKKWGMVVYTDKLDPKTLAPRIGAFPLYMIARGIFGKYGTDIILPAEGIRRLLSIPENRKILEEGRIVVIVDPGMVRAEK